MINWNDKEIKKKTLDATRLAMDRIMAKCIVEAKGDVSVKTATLQGSIRMEPTKLKGGDLVGIWGSYNVKYAIYIETGTDPYIIRPKSKKALFWPGASHPVKVVHHPGIKAQPFLRPAADKYYPNLPGEIRRAMA